jgi:hypothetical protein
MNKHWIHIFKFLILWSRRLSNLCCRRMLSQWMEVRFCDKIPSSFGSNQRQRISWGACLFSGGMFGKKERAECLIIRSYLFNRGLPWFINKYRYSTRPSIPMFLRTKTLDSSLLQCLFSVFPSLLVAGSPGLLPDSCAVLISGAFVLLLSGAGQCWWGWPRGFVVKPSHRKPCLS